MKTARKCSDDETLNARGKRKVEAGLRDIKNGDVMPLKEVSGETLERRLKRVGEKK